MKRTADQIESPWTTQMLIVVAIIEIIAIMTAMFALVFARSAAAACR